MSNYKPQSPLMVNGNGIFPLTTYDQIILANGDRWDGKLGVPVSFASTLNSGTEIGTITIDGIATKLYHQALPLTGGVLSGWLYAKNRLATYTDNYPQIQFCNENQDELGLIFVGTTDGTHQEIRIRAYSNASSYYDHIFFGHGGFQTKGLYLKNNNYPQIQFNNEDGKPRGLIYLGTGDGSPGALAFRAYSDDTNFKEIHLDPSSGILYSNGGFSGYLYGTAQEAVYGLNLKGVHEGKEITSWMSYNNNSPVFITAFDGITQWGIERDGGNTQFYAHFYDTTNGAYLASHILLDHYNYSQYALPLTGGTVTGTLILSNVTDAVGNADNGPALIVGGTRTTAHIEIDPNKIICKTDATTETALVLGHTKGIIVAGPSTFNSTLTSKSYYYQHRNVGSNNAIYFHRNANHAETITTSSGTYSHVLKANGSADMGMIYFNVPYASTRTTVADGTVDNNYVAKGFFHFRTYSIDSSTGARLNYYYNFQLPATPADLTANKTYYAMYQTSEGIISTTAKRYVMGISEANGSVGYNASVYTSGSVLYGACWNDYAEYRNQIEEIKPGYITYSEDDGKLRLTTERLQVFEGIVSDTFGYAIGETEENKTPLAVSGRALVYCDPDDDFHSGDCVCAGPGGLAYRMTREEIMMYPDRIVGIVSEIPAYETWGTGNVEVNGRIWVKVR